MGGGERLLKDIYEALRAGPGWNSTLLWVGYDDAGGFYDHHVPPFEGIPAPEHPCHVAPVCRPPAPPAGWQAVPPSPPCLRPPCTNGSGTTNYSLTAKFDFRRLGMRSAAMLISPYIAPGSVFGAPRGKSTDARVVSSARGCAIRAAAAASCRRRGRRGLLLVRFDLKRRCCYCHVNVSRSEHYLAVRALLHPCDRQETLRAAPDPHQTDRVGSTVR